MAIKTILVCDNCKKEFEVKNEQLLKSDGTLIRFEYPEADWNQISMGSKTGKVKTAQLCPKCSIKSYP